MLLLYNDETLRVTSMALLGLQCVKCESKEETRGLVWYHSRRGSPLDETMGLAGLPVFCILGKM